MSCLALSNGRLQCVGERFVFGRARRRAEQVLELCGHAVKTLDGFLQPLLDRTRLLAQCLPALPRGFFDVPGALLGGFACSTRLSHAIRELFPFLLVRLATPFRSVGLDGRACVAVVRGRLRAYLLRPSPRLSKKLFGLLAGVGTNPIRCRLGRAQHTGYALADLGIAARHGAAERRLLGAGSRFADGNNLIGDFRHGDGPLASLAVKQHIALSGLSCKCEGFVEELPGCLAHRHGRQLLLPPSRRDQRASRHGE
ncbi:hypothetical protein BH09ACT13_BH09ACT13_03930 [soil metagenome]